MNISNIDMDRIREQRYDVVQSIIMFHQSLLKTDQLANEIWVDCGYDDVKPDFVVENGNIS